MGKLFSVKGEDLSFREDTYRILNPDLRNSEIDLFSHYRRYGKKEGRRASPERDVISGSTQGPHVRPRVVILSPSAEWGASTTALAIAEYFSRSNEVVAIFSESGPQLSRFLNYCSEVWVCPKMLEDSYEAEAIAQLISVDVEPSVVFVNTVSAWRVLPHLAQRFVPTVTLVHEFADYVRPDYVFHNVALWSTRVVFPSELVLKRAAELNPRSMTRGCDVIPQAVPTNPYFDGTKENQDEGASGATVVVAAGNISYRKGVDLFIETCRILKKLEPRRDWVFRWIGPGYDEEDDLGYSIYLRAQVKSADLEDQFKFVGAVDDVSPYLDTADFLLLTSRLDPFPNVAVEALRAGLPVICFEGSSGFAEFALKKGFGDRLVVQAFSCEEMAERVRLLLDQRDHRIVSQGLRQLWEKHLTLDIYGAQLDALSKQARIHTQSEKPQADTIEASDFTDMRPQHMVEPQRESRSEAIVHYVRAEATRIDPFRPSASFSPRIWEDLNRPPREESRYFQYLIAERPDGPWNNEVIDFSERPPAEKSNVSILVHIHVHYLDVFEGMLDVLREVSESCEFAVSVTDENLRLPVQRALATRKIRPQIVNLAPDTGRNFGSLFELARNSHWDESLLVCHLHTKKSPQFEDKKTGEGWLDFLLQSLFSGVIQTGLRTISAHFSSKQDLGLVFPVDPLLIGTDSNVTHINTIVEKFGLSSPGYQEDFPVGGMFWIRGNVIRMVAQRFEALEFEPEPISTDGSVAHAIERLMPRAVSSVGYSSSLCFLPGARRE